MIKLATVSPCYNEEEVLRHSVERLTNLFERMIAEGLISSDSMMVFVNDGSRDQTWQLIKELYAENKYVRGINMSRNVGHQNAIMAGMMTARHWADAVVTLDADLQDDIECIPQMVRQFKEGSDIVYGVKVSRQADPMMKRLSAQAFYKLQSSMGVESVYNHADFRLMSRRALDMLATYKEHNLYLRGLIPQIGLQTSTVDDVISERYAGQSKYTLSKMLGLAMNGITAFSVKPLYIIFDIGLLFLVVAFGIAVYVAYSLITGAAVQGWASIMLSIWLVGGLILMSMGVIGTYIGKIYTEVKRRPLYHIQEILGASQVESEESE
jgi:glycosyltransferase involved in cell wall biosynthesis